MTVPSVRECKSLDTPVTFHPDASSSVRPSTAVREPPGPVYAGALAGAPKMVTSGHQASRGREPTLRLGHLLHGQNALDSLGPDEPIERATTLLSLHGKSHIPVLKSKHAALGAVSWRSLGEVRVRGNLKLVRDATVPVQVCSADDAVLDVWHHAERDRAVLVQGKDRRILALLSLEDLAEWMFRVTSPFLLLEELEHHLRNLLDRRLSHALPAGKEAAALTLGEYVRILQNPGVWGSLGLAIDREAFVVWLDAAREARNRAVHFAPEGLGQDDIEKIQKLVVFLRRTGLGLPPEPK